MAATKPTIVLIPGAWFHPSTYDQFISILQRLSYPTVYAPYPSLDPSDPATADAAHDTEAVLQNFLLPLIENEGKDVVILMHSYGGVPGSSAARGLAKAQRSKKAKKGGVVGLIYFSGFVLPDGASVADGQGGQLPAWVKQNEVRFPPLSLYLFSEQRLSSPIMYMKMFGLWACHINSLPTLPALTRPHHPREPSRPPLSRYRPHHRRGERITDGSSRIASLQVSGSCACVDGSRLRGSTGLSGIHRRPSHTAVCAGGDDPWDWAGVDS